MSLNRERFWIYDDDPMGLLENARAIYRCPKDPDTKKRLGPLAGLSSTSPWQPEIKNVSDVYINTGMLDRWPHLITHFASLLSSRMNDSGVRDDARGGTFVAAPMGGMQINFALANILSGEISYLEKTGTALAFRRCLPPDPDLPVVICEDVMTSATTVYQVLGEIAKHSDAKVAAVCTIINRSKVTTVHDIPVVSLVDMPGSIYPQNDPFVQADVDRGNIVWTPKNSWPEMLAVMEGMRDGPR